MSDNVKVLMFLPSDFSKLSCVQWGENQLFVAQLEKFGEITMQIHFHSLYNLKFSLIEQLLFSHYPSFSLSCK